MTSDARRHRPLQHVTATGTALAVALGPVVIGALLVRSAGGDPMASVNALIAGGGQRARISRAQLRSCGGRVQARGRRAGRKARGVAAVGDRLPHRAGRLVRRRAPGERPAEQAAATEA
ncbi:hypothetical protein [Streptomyces sp. NBC_00094]|uniref:hypothetical protein n=1 Tax=Streptomyces sp. NBC_00094 TaxID=2903620 RepID=UPI0022587AF9|nr:hypothetical protein [Streptomyces sp. NBC_00094]MCX5388676.1 hypothetical protein [Streptomyces sp. NBC_00094]